jgi:hypothetical protein
VSEWVSEWVRQPSEGFFAMAIAGPGLWWSVSCFVSIETTWKFWVTVASPGVTLKHLRGANALFSIAAVYFADSVYYQPVMVQMFSAVVILHYPSRAVVYINISVEGRAVESESWSQTWKELWVELESLKMYQLELRPWYKILIRY